MSKEKSIDEQQEFTSLDFDSKEELKDKKIPHGAIPEKKSLDSNNGFIQYIISPEKFDKLIISINDYALTNKEVITRIDDAIEINKKVITRIDDAIQVMKQSNQNQEKTLSLLTELVKNSITGTQKGKSKKMDSEV